MGTQGDMVFRTAESKCHDRLLERPKGAFVRRLSGLSLHTQPPPPPPAESLSLPLSQTCQQRWHSTACLQGKLFLGTNEQKF